MESNEGSLCSFCKSFGKYCCSRCNRKYCSTNCFKNVEHNQCSEQFFKHSVLQELQSQRFDESSKLKIIEILKRNYCQTIETNELNAIDGSLEENDGQELESRFDKLDINCSQNSDLWNKLSDEEKKEFNEMVENGKIGQFVSVWKEWWTQSRHESITQLNDCSQSITSELENKSQIQMIKIPELWPNIEKLSQLTSKSVSPCVCMAVINTIFCYCYVCRLYNGDYYTIESMETFIESCPQLSHNINCDDFTKSIEMCIQQVMREQTSQFAIQILFDLKSIICGPKLMIDINDYASDYVLRALSDSLFIINNAKKKCSKQKRKALKLDLIMKKLEFYLSWSVINGSLLFNSLNEINLLIGSMLSTDETHHLNNSDENFQSKLSQKKLIQEIT